MARVHPSWPILFVLILAAASGAAAVDQLSCTPLSGIYNEDRVDFAWTYAAGQPDSVTLDFHDGTGVTLPGTATSYRHVFRSAGRYDLTIATWSGGVPDVQLERNFVVVAQRDIPGNNVMFVHHSTGRYMLRDAGVRSIFTAHASRGGTEIKLWDHDYHSGNSYTGIIRPDSTVFSNWSYGIEANNIQPTGYADIFDGSAFRDSLFARHDVILFKNDHRTGDIPTAEMLQDHKDKYLLIRDVLDMYPEKLFVMVSGPPRRPESTINLMADNARSFYDWLQSPAYMNGHPNIMFFDLFDELASADDPSDPERNMLREEYRVPPAGNTDSHPNDLANETVGPELADLLIRIFDPGWIDAPTSVATPPALITRHAAAPNPFNPLTWIRYDLGEPALVEVRVFDLSGRLVRTILDPTPQTAGPHALSWDGRNAAGEAAPSGVYLYRIEAGREVRAGRMALVR